MKHITNGFLIVIIVIIVSINGYGIAHAVTHADHHIANDLTSEVENYVEVGLKNNLLIQQKAFSLEKSLEALAEAKGKFLPSVSIEARYSRAHGGRIIDIPIGSIVNPIHGTLNQLLKEHGIPSQFPTTIPDEQIPFLRESEHDTKIRIVQPVFQPAIHYNIKIKKKMVEIEKAKLNAFKRQLVLDIKNAYFTYLKTVKIIELLDITLKVLEEALRVSESLFRNHKVTEDVVYSTKAEICKLNQQQAEAVKNNRLAAAYLNFLLNRSLDAEIKIAPEAGKPEGFKNYDLEILTNGALEKRNEFHQLFRAIEAAQHSIRLHQSRVLPTITAVLDYGFQGETYRFGKKDDYWMGSLVLSWNLFRGGQDAAQKKQAIYDKKKLQAQQQELKSQIKLQVKTAIHNMKVARETVVSAKMALESREKAFLIIARKYHEGMLPYIEYTKARSDFTNAGINHIIAIYDYHINEAELERVSALYEFK